MNTFKRISLATAAVVMSLGFIAFATVPAGATASTNTCTVKSTGTKDTVGNSDSRFVLHNDGTVSASFKVSGDASCQQAVTLAIWQAPNVAQKGKPYNEQKLYKDVSGTFDAGTHTLTAQLPNCYYQVDLVRGSSPTGQNGGPGYGKSVMMGSLHGGTQACKQTPPTTPTPPATPTPSPTVPQQPTSLPNTGAGSDVLLIALGAGVLGTAFQYVRQLRFRSTFDR